jgi:hypothetical protein
VGARSAGQYVAGLCAAVAAVAGGQARCQLIEDSADEDADEAEAEEARTPAPVLRAPCQGLRSALDAHDSAHAAAESGSSWRASSEGTSGVKAANEHSDASPAGRLKARGGAVQTCRAACRRA